MGISDLRSVGNKLTNLFWKGLILSTVDVLEKIPFIYPNLYGLVPICGNSNFKISKNLINKSFFRSIENIHAAEYNNNSLSKDTFFIHFRIDLNFLEYHNVVHAIKIGLEKWHFELNRIYNVNTWETFKYSCGGIKYLNYPKWLQLRILS